MEVKPVRSLSGTGVGLAAAGAPACAAPGFAGAAGLGAQPASRAATTRPTSATTAPGRGRRERGAATGPMGRAGRFTDSSSRGLGAETDREWAYCTRRGASTLPGWRAPVYNALKVLSRRA